MAEEANEPTPWRRAFERVPAAGYFGVLVAIFAVLLLARPLSPDLLFAKFVEPYVWGPIVHGEGFNPVSTVLLLVVATLLLLWFLRLLKSYGEQLDLELVVAVLPVFAWGSMLRVLEDSDLFAPFARDAALLGMPERTSCLPQAGGGFLENCFGVLFITPIVWVWAVLLLFVLARLGLLATQAGARWGRAAALGAYAATLVAGLLAVHALLAAAPGAVRHAPPVWVLWGSAAVAFLIVAMDARRTGNVRWRRALLASSTAIALVGAYYVAVWMSGGAGSWRPSGTLRPGVLLGLVAAPLLVAASIALKVGGMTREGLREGRPSRLLGLLIYLLLIESAAIFVAAAAPADSLDARGIVALLLIGPGAVAVGTTLAWWGSVRAGGHALLLLLARPHNLLVVASQALDAFMTAVSIDVFGAGEKQGVPRALIGFVRDLDLPGPFSSHPAALVMVAYKLPLAILLVWTLDRHLAATAEQRDFSGLVKMGAIAVALAPGIREALRLAMGV